MSDIDHAISVFRHTEAALMDTTVTVRRPAGAPTFDPDTGQLTTTSTTIYTGPALVRSNMWQGVDVQLGQQERRIRGIRAKFPADTALEPNDVITVDASSHDARLVGKAFTVTDVLVDEWQISSTVMAEEVT